MTITVNAVDDPPTAEDLVVTLDEMIAVQSIWWGRMPTAIR